MADILNSQDQDRKSRRFKLGVNRGHDWPISSVLDGYFCNYDWNKWTEHGSDEGLFEVSIEKRQKKRKISLVFVAPPNQRGLYVRLSVVQTGELRSDYYCFWDKALLGNNFEEVHNNYPLSNALVIPHALALQTVREFIASDGGIPTCLEWTKFDQLPAEAFPVPEGLI